jgi:hypothetical protein
MSTRLDRRTFLKGAGVGSIALVGAPAILTMGATPALADGDDTIRFFFSAVDNTGSPVDSLIMQGCGEFEHAENEIAGHGFFVHFDATTPGTPKLIKATGLWKTQRLVSFHSIGSFGVNLSGVMVADVKLMRQFPEPEATIPAVLTVVCNIPPAGLFTGLDEGFQLVVASLGLTFMPMHPTLGASGFSHSLDD